MKMTFVGCLRSSKFSCSTCQFRDSSLTFPVAARWLSFSSPGARGRSEHRRNDRQSGGSFGRGRRGGGEKFTDLASLKMRLAENEFRTLNIPGITKTPPRPQRPQPVYNFGHRSDRMRVDQDWTSVWPTARSFHPSVVPLPLRQGQTNNLTENDGVPPDKFGNTELMKIPNFLHLTPAHVKQHCDAIKHLCTPWPSQIPEEKLREHFPMTVTTKDYLRSSRSIRDERARRVELSVPLSSLKFLDADSREFLFTLLKFSDEHRLNSSGTHLCFSSQRCPTRKQNYDFLVYVLTALSFQCKQHEKFQDMKEHKDNLFFKFQGSSSEQKLQELAQAQGTSPPKEVVDEYAKSLTDMFDKAESLDSVEQYSQAAKKLLNVVSIPRRRPLVKDSSKPQDS